MSDYGLGTLIQATPGNMSKHGNGSVKFLELQNKIKIYIKAFSKYLGALSGWKVIVNWKIYAIDLRCYVMSLVFGSVNASGLLS